MIDFDSAPSSASKQAPKQPGSSPSYVASVSPAGPPPKPLDPNDLPDYLAGLNPPQREAALATEGPLIVLAGAGSGKTKMVTARISYLIDFKRVPPNQILAVTFTNKAANEMRERVERMLHGSSALGAPEIGTFHAICVRMIRMMGAATPFTKPFVIYDDSDQLSLIKATLKKLNIDEKAFNPKSMQYAIDRAKCDAIEPQDMQPAPHNLFDKNLKRVFEQYQKDLFSNNALDFGEIICLAYRLLRDNPELRARFQRRFRYIHVDEYQDTNRAQYLLLSQLAGATTGGHQNICVVGDEDQSIYRWRGADIRNILDFEKDFPGATVVKLEQNYRSTKTIITAAGKVIRNNKERKDKTLWTDNDQGFPIIRAQVPDERAEAEMVVAEIKRIAANDGRTLADFSVFYRTHAQSRPFEDVLRREKIPYQIVGGLKFYDRKEIKDILSYFKGILNTSDSISLKRVINVPARGIGKTTLDKLDEHHVRKQVSEDPAYSYWQVLQDAASSSSLTSTGTAKKIGQFVNLMNRLMAEQPKLMLSELYHLILDETGYVRELRSEGTEESLARIENLEEFDTLLQEFEEDIFEKLPPEGTSEGDAQRLAKKSELLSLFIEQSALASETAERDNSGMAGGSVKMMSLHSSKGLEFPVVFLVGMEEGLFPSIRPWEETPDEDVEEERRLCYVGMTRARETLYMSNAVVRRLWGNVTYQEPARFFTELPPDLVEYRDFTRGSAAGRFRTGSSRAFPETVAQASGRGMDGTVTKKRSAAAAVSEDGFGPAPSFDDFSQVSDYQDDVVGCRVNHPDYGVGKIIAATGTGEDVKVTIEFKGRDQRKFILRYIRKYLESV